jgi:hypothetical protein
VVALSQVQALVILFVVLPFAVAGGVIAFVSWRSSAGPPPVRTSDILATGEEGHAEILAVRSFGGLFDTRPMVRLDLRITPRDGDVFDLQVTQSFPRAYARTLKPGDRVEVRVLADRAHAAVVASPAEDA